MAISVKLSQGAKPGLWELSGGKPIGFKLCVGARTEGLMLVHNCLLGTGLRADIRIGASGKVASGVDIVSRVCQGADFLMAARSMMFAVGWPAHHRSWPRWGSTGFTSSHPPC